MTHISTTELESAIDNGTACFRCGRSLTGPGAKSEPLDRWFVCSFPFGCESADTWRDLCALVIGTDGLRPLEGFTDQERAEMVEWARGVLDELT